MRDNCDDFLFQVEKLQQQRSEKELELMALLKRTPVDIWVEDLDAFLAEWDVSIRSNLH